MAKHHGGDINVHSRRAHIVSLLGEVFVSSYTSFLADGCPGTGHHRSNGCIVGERGGEIEAKERGERKGDRDEVEQRKT